MDINYYAILVGSVLAMVVGALWYGPLFGNMWMKIIGISPEDKQAREKMQKSAGPLYLIQFVLTLFQVFVLAMIVANWKDSAGYMTALWVWAGFVIPTIAGTAMWNNDSAKISWGRFLIQGGYQLTIFLIFGLLLTYWT